MLSGIVSTLVGGSGGFEGSEQGNTTLVSKLFTTTNYQQLDNIVNSGSNPNRPKAYLNYVLFDEDMRIVGTMAGAFQANGNGSGNWTTIGTEEGEDLVMPANGYLAVYLSNKTAGTCIPCADVYFDLLTVRFTRGNLLEETHYYPHGLPIYGLSGRTATGFQDNRRKYQSNEYIKDLGLNWMDFHARQYDPQLGRFLGVDPLADGGGQQVWSPYAAMGNAPESLVDPDGLQSRPGLRSLTPGSDGMDPMDIGLANYYGSMSGSNAFSWNGGFGKGLGGVVETYYGETARQAWAGMTGQSYARGSGINNPGGYQTGGVTDDGVAEVTWHRGELSQKGALMATNLYKGYNGPGDPASEAFWASYDETFFNMMPGVNILNMGSKIFTGKNLNGNNFGGVNMLEAAGPPIGRIGKFARIATVEEQAAELSAKIGKNSVNIKTVEGQIHFDLLGATHKGVPTPHVQKSFWNTNPRGVIFLNKDRQWVRPMNQQDIRIITNYLKKLN